MPRFLVFEVQPARRGVGNLDIVTTAEWKPFTPPIEADTPEDAMSRVMRDVYGILVAVKLGGGVSRKDAISSFYRVTHRTVIDPEEIRAAADAVAVAVEEDGLEAAEVRARLWDLLQARDEVTLERMEEGLNEMLGATGLLRENHHPEGSVAPATDFVRPPLGTPDDVF